MGVGWHKKPRWHGPAPSKKFVLPPMDHTPPDDTAQLLRLSWQHRDRMAAISKFLYDDFLRHSASGAAAKEAALLQRAEDKQLLIDNENMNAQVAKKREERLAQEQKEREERISLEVEEFEQKQRLQDRQMEEFIKSETRALENKIQLDDLEKAIESALDNPVDHEFAIDTAGHIFRGRETKSILVPEDEREKIPRPAREHEKLLNMKV